jgi:hypothetical protein
MTRRTHIQPDNASHLLGELRVLGVLETSLPGPAADPMHARSALSAFATVPVFLAINRLPR